MEEPFKPIIWIKHSESVPQPIFIVGIVGIEFYKVVNLPDKIEYLNLSDQIKLVKKTIVNHYRQNQFKPSPFGIISGYFYLRDSNTTFEFDTKGNPLRLFGKINRGHITLKVNNQNVLDLFQDYLIKPKSYK